MSRSRHSKPKGYDAFISYSREADLSLAEVLQKDLSRFAVPWYRARGRRIFRDVTGIGMTPELWPAIREKLSNSRSFFLLASPEAARSCWVSQETRHWLKNCGPQVSDSRRRLPSLVLTDGDLKWSGSSFDRRSSTALPRSLLTAYLSEPSYVDLRGRRAEWGLKARKRRRQFRHELAAMVAVIEDMKPEDVLKLDERYGFYLKLAGWFLGVSTSAVVTLVVILAFNLVSQHNRTKQAEKFGAEQENIAKDQSKSAAAEKQRADDLKIQDARKARETADSLIREGRQAEALAHLAYSIKEFPPEAALAAESAMVVLNLNHCPLPAKIFSHPAPVSHVAFSPKGTDLVAVAGELVWFRDLRGKASLRPFDGHKGKISGFAYSEDGRHIATSSVVERKALVWEAATHRIIGRLDGRGERFKSVSFSPREHHVVTVSESGQASLWRAEGDLIAPLAGAQGVKSAVFSPDRSKVLTASSDRSARLWNAKTGQPLQDQSGVPLKPFMHNDEVSGAEFNRKGDLIVTIANQNAYVWDLNGDKPLATLSGHRERVYQAHFSPDGRKIVTCSGDGTAMVWKAEGEALHTLGGHRGLVFDAVFDPRGERILTCSRDRTARVWDLASGTLLTLFREHQGDVFEAAFSPDGTKIATASQDQTTRLFESDSPRLGLFSQKHLEACRSVDFSKDGDFVLTASNDKTVRIWSAANGTLKATFPHETGVSEARFYPDGKRVMTLAFDGKLRIWPSDETAPPTVVGNEERRVVHAALSPGGDLIATGDSTGLVRIWNAHDGMPIVTMEESHAMSVYRVSFSSDGGRLVSCSQDHTARVWDVTTGKRLFTVHHASDVLDAVFSPDGQRIATASWDKTARLWDAGSGTPIGDPCRHGREVFRVCFSPDSSKLVTASADGLAGIWQASDGKSLCFLRGHQQDQWVKRAVFSPDGRRIATVSTDGTARIWDAGTGVGLASFARHQGEVTDVEFRSDGKGFATAGGDGNLILWRCLPANEVVPAWFPDFLTALGQRRLGDKGEVIVVEAQEVEKLREKLRGIAATEKATSFSEILRLYVKP